MTPDERFGQRFLIHLGRLAAWFRAVGMITTDPEAVVVESWAWVGELTIYGESEPNIEIAYGILSDGPAHLKLVCRLAAIPVHPAEFIVPFAGSPREWIPLDDWKQQEKCFRLLTSDDTHARIRDTVLAWAG